LKIAVIGLGHVGAVTAVCLANAGHEVIAIDADPAVMSAIGRGLPPVIEPGLAEVFAATVASGRLRAGTYGTLAEEAPQLVIVCVGTPGAADGSLDASQVVDAARQLAEALGDGRDAVAVVFRSTLMPGTMDDRISPLFATLDHVSLGYNPEFLREGSAIADFLHPSRIVIAGAEEARRLLRSLYAFIGAPVFETSFRVAETVKLVDNTFHALKVSFANEIGRFASVAGIDSAQLFEIFLADRQLNISPRYLTPGLSFGGPCLPKDVAALSAALAQAGIAAPLVGGVLNSNAEHRRFLVRRVGAMVPKEARAILLGLGFKSGTADVRGSVVVELVDLLLAEGRDIDIFDLELSAEALRSLPPRVRGRLLTAPPSAEGGWQVVLAGREVDVPAALAGLPVLRMDLL